MGRANDESADAPATPTKAGRDGGDSEQPIPHHRGEHSVTVAIVLPELHQRGRSPREHSAWRPRIWPNRRGQTPERHRYYPWREIAQTGELVSGGGATLAGAPSKDVEARRAKRSREHSPPKGLGPAILKRALERCERGGAARARWRV